MHHHNSFTIRQLHYPEATKIKFSLIKEIKTSEQKVILKTLTQL